MQFFKGENMTIETSYRKYFIKTKKIDSDFLLEIVGNKKSYEFKGSKDAILSDIKAVFDHDFINKITLIINKLENL